MLLARRGLLGLLLFALVAAQALGLMHRIVHAGKFQAESMVVTASSQARGNDGLNWTKTLFGVHDDDSGCRLFDELSQGGCLPTVPALVLPPAPPFFFLQWFQGEALARWAALFDARGPPQLR